MCNIQFVAVNAATGQRLSRHEQKCGLDFCVYSELIKHVGLTCELLSMAEIDDLTAGEYDEKGCDKPGNTQGHDLVSGG